MPSGETAAVIDRAEAAWGRGPEARLIFLEPDVDRRMPSHDWEVLFGVVRITPSRAAERMEEFEKRFANRAGEVSKSPGSRLRAARPSDGRDVCLVYTRWSSEEAFNDWVNSPPSSTATRPSTQGPVGTASGTVGFDVIQQEGA